MRKILLNIILALGLIMPVLVPTGSALAACPPGNSSRGQALQGIGENNSNGGCNDSGVANLINTIVTILSLIVGAAAVIMVILAGFKYVTSGGEQQAVANAKSTLIYALVGIAIAALAQFLVHFVLNRTTVGLETCPSNHSLTKSDPRCK